MTINLSRRGFLASAAALVAVKAAPVPISLEPVAPHLWGDGIHDDGPALQWLIDEADRSGRPFVLREGTFRTHQTLVLRGPIDWHMNYIFSDTAERSVEMIDMEKFRGRSTYNVFFGKSMLSDERLAAIT